MVKTVSRHLPAVDDFQLKSIDHVVHEQRYVTAIREQPEINDDAKSCLSRVVGDLVGVEPVDEPFEHERTFSFQLDDAAA